MTNENVLSKIDMVDLDKLPDTIVITYMEHGRRMFISKGDLLARLLGPGGGNRTPRGAKERAASQAGIALLNLFRAIDAKDDAKVKKYRARCDDLMGPLWAEAKLAERQAGRLAKTQETDATEEETSERKAG